MACLLAGLIWWLSSSKNGVNYVTEPATTGDLTVVVTATGSIQPINQVDVSSELSGTGEAVLVDYNRGEGRRELAELATDTLEVNVQSARAKLAAANANVAQAHATIAYAKSVLDRKAVLVGRNVSSSQDLARPRAYDAAVAAARPRRPMSWRPRRICCWRKPISPRRRSSRRSTASC